jgi:peptide/nickel transport system substrate-binding protein
MKKRTSWVLVSLLVIVSILTAACNGGEEATTAPEPTDAPAAAATEAPTEEPTEEPTEAPAEVEEPKIVRVAMGSDIASVDPSFITGGVENMVGEAILPSLVTADPVTHETVNDLAEWIEVSDDGLEISFKLKEGIMWQRGYGEVTAEDVKFSFERMIDEELGGWYFDDWSTLDHVEVTGKYEGTIILKELFAPLWTTTLPAYSGKVLPKAYIEEVGHEAFGTDPVGVGPYLFDEWVPLEKVVLKRDPNYYGDAPYYDEIHLLVIEDTQAAEAALEAGEIDFTFIELTSVERFEADPDFKVTVLPTLGYQWIGMNIENPKLEDINVRQAIRYAIDVPGIIQVAYDGLVDQSKTLIPPGVLGHWEDAPMYERDVDLAKEYMAKAGLESLDLRIDYDSTYPAFGPVAEVAQANLAEIGINLEISPVDSAAFWELGMGDEGINMELFVIGYSMYPDPMWASMWFVCDQVGVWNWMRWCSEEYDALYHESNTSLDPAERERIHAEMEQVWNDGVHTIWLTHGRSAWAGRADLMVDYETSNNYIVYSMRPAE